METLGLFLASQNLTINHNRQKRCNNTDVSYCHIHQLLPVGKAGMLFHLGDNVPKRLNLNTNAVDRVRERVQTWTVLQS